MRRDPSGARAKGRKTIGPHDLQIAAVALRHDLTLVTHKYPRVFANFGSSTGRLGAVIYFVSLLDTSFTRGWRIPDRAAGGPNTLACGHSGRISRAPIRVAHSTLVLSGTEHTAALDRSTLVRSGQASWRWCRRGDPRGRWPSSTDRRRPRHARPD